MQFCHHVDKYGNTHTDTPPFTVLSCTVVHLMFDVSLVRYVSLLLGIVIFGQFRNLRLRISLQQLYTVEYFVHDK